MRLDDAGRDAIRRSLASTFQSREEPSCRLRQLPQKRERQMSFMDELSQAPAVASRMQEGGSDRLGGQRGNRKSKNQ